MTKPEWKFWRHWIGCFYKRGIRLEVREGNLVDLPDLPHLMAEVEPDYRTYWDDASSEAMKDRDENGNYGDVMGDDGREECR